MWEEVWCILGTCSTSSMLFIRWSSKHCPCCTISYTNLGCCICSHLLSSRYTIIVPIEYTPFFLFVALKRLVGDWIVNPVSSTLWGVEEGLMDIVSTKVWNTIIGILDKNIFQTDIHQRWHTTQTIPSKCQRSIRGGRGTREVEEGGRRGRERRREEEGGRERRRGRRLNDTAHPPQSRILISQRNQHVYHFNSSSHVKLPWWGIWYSPTCTVK